MSTSKHYTIEMRAFEDGDYRAMVPHVSSSDIPHYESSVTLIAGTDGLVLTPAEAEILAAALLQAVKGCRS